MLSDTRNPFIMLVLGVIPVKFLLVKKRMVFLQYILKESTSSIIKQVFEALKLDSRKGDFVNLTNKDLFDLDICQTNNEIECLSTLNWKKLGKMKTNEAALTYLTKENKKKDETNTIIFPNLKLSEYHITSISHQSLKPFLV